MSPRSHAPFPPPPCPGRVCAGAFWTAAWGGRAVAVALLVGLGGVSCDRPTTSSQAWPKPGPAADYTAAGDEFAVMTFNLLRYSMEDRDGDGQRDDPKPPEERAAVIELIKSASPDVLAVQEMGGPDVFDAFKEELRQAGLTYEFQEYLQREQNADRQVNLAVLSRRPIVSHQSHVDDVYTIGEFSDVPVARGFIDVDIGVTPAYQFRLMVAHLKSKVFHELGQTEMRRNEARLLNKHVRDALKANPRLNLLLVGDLNDTPPSRAIREVIGNETPYLFDLRPTDTLGDSWTHFRREHDEYSRIDYAMVSEAMRPEVVRSKTRVIRDPRTAIASDHRPLVAVFTAKDRPVSSPPD